MPLGSTGRVDDHCPRLQESISKTHGRCSRSQTLQKQIPLLSGLIYPVKGRTVQGQVLRRDKFSAVLCVKCDEPDIYFFSGEGKVEQAIPITEHSNHSPLSRAREQYVNCD